MKNSVPHGLIVGVVVCGVVLSGCSFVGPTPAALPAMSATATPETVLPPIPPPPVTSVPPAATPVTPTATSIPPTATPVSPTASPVLPMPTPTVAANQWLAGDRWEVSVEDLVLGDSRLHSMFDGPEESFKPASGYSAVRARVHFRYLKAYPDVPDPTAKLNGVGLWLVSGETSASPPGIAGSNLSVLGAGSEPPASVQDAALVLRDVTLVDEAGNTYPVVGLGMGDTCCGGMTDLVLAPNISDLILVAPEAESTYDFVFVLPTATLKKPLRLQYGPQPLPASPTAQPSQTPTTATVLEAIVQAADLNLREGPGLNYPVLRTVHKNDRLSIRGQTGRCAWIDVETKAGVRGWVAGSAQFVKMSISCEAVPKSYFRPLTAILQRAATGGPGELTVENGNDEDALIILAQLDGEPVMGAYVRAGDSVLMDGIPDGDYYLFYAKGQAWDGDRQQFTNMASSQRFEEQLSFTSGGGNYMSYTATLYPVASGTARIEDVDPDDFPSLE